MKSFLKISLISLGSLLGVVILTAGIVLWLIFTPGRITPIINSQAAKFVDGDIEIGRTSLTFFKTFPRFGIEIDGLTIVSPLQGAPSDTLLNLRNFRGAIDIRALLQRNEIILTNIRLDDGSVNAFVGCDGKANFDVIPGSDTPQDTVSSFNPGMIDADDIRLKNINIVYTDASLGMKASIDNLTAAIKGSVDCGVKGSIDAESGRIAFEYLPEIKDSIQTHMTATLAGLSLCASGSLKDGALLADVKANSPGVSFAYGGEQYLDDRPLDIDLAAGTDTAFRSIDLKKLAVVLDGLPLTLSGSVRNRPETGIITTDLAYSSGEWPVREIIALIPASFVHYMEGMDAAGMLRSYGTIKGDYAEGKMPEMDIHLALSGCSVSYPRMIPFPLDGIDADLDIHTDLTDTNSRVLINNFKARTPESSLGVSGFADRLFSDIHANIKADVNIALGEFASILPEETNIAVAGNLSGNIRADFTLPQLENMELHRIKASGILFLDDADILYDTVSLKTTGQTRLDFALPNLNPKTKNTGFASIAITSGIMSASAGSSIAVELENMSLSLETSDVRDTAHIPALLCKFKFDRLEALMDDMALSALNPSGSISLASKSRRSDNPRFSVSWVSGAIKAGFGDEGNFTADDIDIKATVIYDKDADNPFLKLMPRGSVALTNGLASLASIPAPVEIPALSMRFTPREFNIDSAKVIFDKSDFSLSGTLGNILPHLRDGDMLSGEFAFNSDFTDINFLMSVTNGMGDGEEIENTDGKAAGKSEDIIPATEGKADGSRADISGERNNPPFELTGASPYMVPRNMNLRLSANIKNAAFGNQTITNIDGDIYLTDGSLILEGLSLGAPAAQMVITAKYRTPRRNHLYVGFDLHMIKIDLADLLDLIPDLETIMPMLTSLSGHAEFHAAGEGYLDSLYRFKISTLRGAASLRGSDLVIIDNELFRDISRKLLFSRKTENKIDSLAAEFTVFRNEIDVFPFLLSIDKYKVVIGGRHYIDMNLDYNIALVNSPLPIRLSVKVYGNLDKQRIKLIRNPYKGYFKPIYHNVVEGNQMQLRNMIHEELKKAMLRYDDDQNHEADIPETTDAHTGTMEDMPSVQTSAPVPENTATED